MIHKIILYILLIMVIVSLFNGMAVADPDGYEPIIFTIGFQDRDSSCHTFETWLREYCVPTTANLHGTPRLQYPL